MHLTSSATANIGIEDRPPKPKLVLRPRSGWQPVNLKEVWRNRELVVFLALRDIQVRYKQTVLGALWAIIQPVASMVVFTVFFHKLAGVESAPGVNYAVFTFTALLPWQLFEGCMQGAGNSLVSNQQLVTKVYFPRLSIPLAALLSAVVDFGIAFAVLIGLMLWFGMAIPLTMLTMPVFMLMALAAALGVALWLSAMNVQYRDVRYAIPFLARVWFFITPVVYSVNTVPEKWRVIYALNPMVSAVEGFRWAVLGTSDLNVAMLLASLASITVLLVSGLYYFQRVERIFADVV